MNAKSKFKNQRRLHNDQIQIGRTKAQIGDYEAVVGKSRPGNFENKHQQAGDPDKAGKVIVDVVHNDDLPEILTLGKAAVTAVKSTLEAKIAELDKWAEVSASCDYEEGK